MSDDILGGDSGNSVANDTAASSGDTDILSVQDTAGTYTPNNDGDGGQPNATDQEQAKPPVVPDKYEWALPEGVTVEDAVRTKFDETFKKHGLTQDAVNDLLALQNEFNKVETPEQAEQRIALERAEFTKSNLDELRSDPEWGGQRLAETTDYARKAFSYVADDSLKTFLAESGFGNYPPLVRAFAKFGKAMSEQGSIFTGASPNTQQKSIAQRIYPNMNP